MVNSTNIFWYLLDKMSTHIPTIPESEKQQIEESVKDFLVQHRKNIKSKIQLGETAASSIAIRLFLISVDSSSDQPEQQELNDIRQKILYLKGIERQVLNFLEKLSNSKELSTDDLKFSRILSLYISLCYKSLEFVKEQNVLLKKISQSIDMLQLLEQATKTCETSAYNSCVEMIKQLRITKPKSEYRRARSNKHRQGQLITIQPEYREMTPDEREQLDAQEVKSKCAIHLITTNVKEILKNLGAFSRKLNECIGSFDHISETFNSLVGNISFFDFMMSLFQGQIEESRFSNVSIDLQTFNLSLQTEREKLFQYLKEITNFKEEKEQANRLRDLEKDQFYATKCESCQNWDRIMREELEKKQREHQQWLVSLRCNSSESEWASD